MRPDYCTGGHCSGREIGPTDNTQSGIVQVSLRQFLAIIYPIKRLYQVWEAEYHPTGQNAQNNLNNNQKPSHGWSPKCCFLFQTRVDNRKVELAHLCASPSQILRASHCCLPKTMDWVYQCMLVITVEAARMLEASYSIDNCGSSLHHPWVQIISTER